MESTSRNWPNQANPDEAIEAEGDGVSSVQDKSQSYSDTPRDKASEVAGQAQQKAGEVTTQAQQKAQEQLETGREQAATGMYRAAESLREKVGEGGSTPQQAGVKVAEGMEGAATYLQQHSTNEIWTDLEEYMRQHPGQALAGAVFAGFVLGRILR